MPDGPQYDLSTAVQDPDFVRANMMDKIAFLSAHDSDFAGANVKDKMAYLNHILPTGQSETAAQQPASSYGKLTSSYNPKLEEWAQSHPVAGPILRFLDSAGGAFIGAPETIVKGIAAASKQAAHPYVPTDESIETGRSIGAWKDPNVRKAALSLLPEALGQGVGNVAGGEAAGVAAGAVGEVGASKVGSMAMDARLKLNQAVRDPLTGKIRTPYEMAAEKVLGPDPYAPTAIPAKAIPKGTNFGQWLEQQKILKKQAAIDAQNAPATPGTPLTPGGRIVDPNSPVPPALRELTNYPREALFELAKKGDLDAIAELRRNPARWGLPPNSKFLLELK